MLKMTDRAGLDYFQLLTKSRHLDTTSLPELRLALLADVSTQHLAVLLKVLFAENGLKARIYEAGYDTVELEAFDARSGLYAFDPQVVVILQSTAKLAAAYYGQEGDRQGFASARARSTEAVWHAVLAGTHAHVVQSTLVLPSDRPFGHYGRKVADCLQSVVTEIDREIGLRARAVPGVLVLDLDELAGWIGRPSGSRMGPFVGTFSPWK